jgi:hypothetical protein
LTVRTYPNQKPWITGIIRTELKGRAAIFKEWDLIGKLIINPAMPSNEAKCQYRTKIESYYTGSDARRMWQGQQTTTGYKGKHRRKLPSDTNLPELNYFKARFKGSNTEASMSTSAVLDNCEITLSIADVSQHSQGGLPGRVL